MWRYYFVGHFEGHARKMLPSCLQIWCTAVLCRFIPSSLVLRRRIANIRPAEFVCLPYRPIEAIPSLSLLSGTYFTICASAFWWLSFQDLPSRLYSDKDLTLKIAEKKKNIDKTATRLGKSVTRVGCLPQGSEMRAKRDIGAGDISPGCKGSPWNLFKYWEGAVVGNFTVSTFG